LENEPKSVMTLDLGVDMEKGEELSLLEENRVQYCPEVQLFCSAEWS
jgi:hypothetical protein